MHCPVVSTMWRYLVEADSAPTARKNVGNPSGRIPHTLLCFDDFCFLVVDTWNAVETNHRRASDAPKVAFIDANGRVRRTNAVVSSSIDGGVTLPKDKVARACVFK